VLSCCFRIWLRPPIHVGDYFACGMSYMFRLIMCRRLLLLAFVNIANDNFYVVDLLVHVSFSRVATDSGCSIAVKLSVCTVQPLPVIGSGFFSSCLKQLRSLTRPT